jgi:hypothetical protein
VSPRTNGIPGPISLTIFTPARACKPRHRTKRLVVQQPGAKQRRCCAAVVLSCASRRALRAVAGQHIGTLESARGKHMHQAKCIPDK